MSIDKEARFTNHRLLGEGGMGQVYRAWDRLEGREVALKRMRPELSGSVEAQRGFETEVRTMRRLSHPGLVRAHAVGRLADGTRYVTMDVLPGPSLDVLESCDATSARRLLIEALEALDFLHARGILHHDLKPENLRLNAEGRLVLMDLGLAGPKGESFEVLRGTPLYVSPEAARHERLDARSELYTLGATFYHVLAGRPPFDAESIGDLLAAHQHQAPQPLAVRRPDLPADVADLLMAMLAKSPLERPQSAREALERLGETRFLGYEPGLVGREPVLSSLLSALDGHGSQTDALTLVAPAGTGKTRVLDAFAFEAQMAGKALLWASGRDATGEPYSGVAAIRRGLEILAEQRSSERLEALRADLDGERGDLEPRAAQLRVHAAWEQLIRAAAGPDRLVFVVDDWDQADEASRNLLQALARRNQAPMVLFTSAQEEALGTAVTLDPLGPEACAELIAHMLGQEANATFVAGLYRLTAGSPLLLLGAMRELLRQGRIPRAGGEWLTDRVDLSRFELSSDARALAQRLLDGLSSDARRLAQGLALAERPLEPSRLADWLGMGEWQDAERELVERMLASRSPEGLRLIQPMVIGLLTEALTPQEGQSLHGVIAKGLESLALPSRDADLARLWFAAGERARAIPYALAASRRLLAHYSLGEADRMLRLALAAPELKGAARAEALEVAGDVARYRAEFERALEAYEEAIALRETHGGRLARLQVNLALVFHMQSRFETALAMASEGASAAEREDDAAEEARAWTTLARLRHFTGDAAGALEASQRGLERARNARNRELEAEALGMLGYLHVGDPARLEDALAHLDASLRIRDQLGDALGLNDGYMLLGNAQMALGRYLEAKLSFARNLTLCRDVGAARDDEATARINLAQVSGETGSYAEALAEAGAAITLVDASGNRFLEGYALALRGRLRACLGQVEPATEDVANALALAEQLANPYLEIAARVGEAACLLLAGRPEDARTAAAKGLTLTRETGIAEYEVDLLLEEGKALRALAEDAAAQEAVLEATHLAQARKAAGKHAQATLEEARLAQDRGEWEKAKVKLDEAKSLGEACGMAPLLAEAALLEGLLAYHEGRPLEAIRILRQTQRHLNALGLKPLADAAGEALAAAQQATNGAGGGMGDVIADFGRMVTGTLRYEEVLDRVIDQVMEITGADRGMIMLVDGAGALSGLVMRPLNEASSPHLMAFSRTFAQAALTERRSLWVADAQSDARFSKAQSVMALDLRTVICVPLLVEDTPLGLLYLDQQTINRTFREEDLRLVEGLAGFAALAIANARRFEEAQERSAMLAAVQEIAKLVTMSAPRAEVLETILRQALQVARAEWGILFGREPLAPVAARDREGRAVDPRWDDALLARAERTAQPLLSLSVPDPEGSLSVMALPMRTASRYLGLLYVAATSESRAFTPADLSALEVVAAQGAIALEAVAVREEREAHIARLEKALRLVEDQREAANLDPVTGVFGREYFLGCLREEVREAQREGGTLSLLVLDPARIGELNVRFGRETGDGVLGRIASELKAVSRQSDVVARIGEDEFAVLLPGIPKAAATELGERVLRELEALALLDAEGHAVWELKGVTAAVEWRSPEGPEDCLGRALAALTSRA